MQDTHEEIIKQGILPVLEMMESFIAGKDRSRVTEIGFWFPSIFGRRVTLLCSQVQSAGFGALMEENGLDFVFFLIINDIRRWI